MRIPYSLLLATILVAACGAETPHGTGDGGAAVPQEPACDEVLASWQRLYDGSAGPGPTVALGHELVWDPARGGRHAAADGDTGTVARFTVPGEVVLQLAETLWVGGLRYHPVPGAPAVTDFRVEVSHDGRCWGEPFGGAFDGSDGGQQVTFPAEPARYVRFRALGSSAPSGEAQIADLDILVGAEVRTRPRLHAAVGLPWTYRPEASIPGWGELAWELREAPAGMAVDAGGTVTWVPSDEQAGTHDVVLAASRGAASLEQSFSVRVASRTRAGGGTVTPEGGTVIVSGTGTALDGLEVVVPPHDGGAVTVWVLEESAVAPGPRELADLGPAFLVEADVPEGTPVELRLPLDALPEVPPEELFLTSFGQDAVAEPFHGAADELVPVASGSAGETTFTASSRLDRYLRFARGRTVSLSRDEFHMRYFLDAGQGPEGVAAKLDQLGDWLVASRDHFLATRCTFRSRQDVAVRDIEPRGQVWGDDGLMELDKPFFDEDAPSLVRYTVAHEVTHIFQWLSGGNQFPWEPWWTEGTAVYGGDDVFDAHVFTSRYHPWDARVTSVQLQDDEAAYRRGAFFKSLAAQHGGFDVCAMARARLRDGEGMRALGSVLGGAARRLESFATFVAAYNFIRTEELMEGAEALFDPSDPEFVDRVGRGEDDVQRWRWLRTLSLWDGGYTARFEAPPRPTDLTLRVHEPADHYLALVHDAGHALVGRLEPDHPELVLPSVSEHFYVTLALRQDRLAPAHEVDVEVTGACEEDGCGDACAGEGARCSGSGPRFDHECCGDLVCVVGACRPPGGGRERALCDHVDAESCASGLACRHVGSQDADRTCCARDTDYCEAKEDCCGLMECEGNRCVGRLRGESCLLGDCTGGSYCLVIDSTGTCM